MAMLPAATMGGYYTPPSVAHAISQDDSPDEDEPTIHPTERAIHPEDEHSMAELEDLERQIGIHEELRERARSDARIQEYTRTIAQLVYLRDTRRRDLDVRRANREYEARERNAASLPAYLRDHGLEVREHTILREQRLENENAERREPEGGGGGDGGR
jgi:hypothetical protein